MFKMWSVLGCALFCVLMGQCESSGLERVLTINVDPGKVDCFYQYVQSGYIIDIEYQVIDGGQGALDIGFVVLSPSGRVLTAPGRRQASSHRSTASSAGDYRFCFDNTHSKFNSKTVYFDLMVDAESEEDEEDENAGDKGNKDEAEQDDPTMGGDSGEWHIRLGDLVSRLRHNVAGARRLQEAVAATAARDLHYAERSLFRVTLCSALQAVAMLAVGVLQVIMVRSLFEDRSRVNVILNKIPIGRS